ncbi:NADH-quinone oxidoreductase subunit A [Fontisphaera persica]|jgi:NADH-quinone oxidoreductase subunit A|uniref:NADH-quinone oxidoreductase subunit A n=1 Tax=Fontisphaera persica TaxID=2974023 RepID=UPI0024C01700|nr:NADH-quinone oxidoreductase subunit A [Fontisphaera persica]WCJ60416.1 NADH-quinone oxidoreductase subunit A [Fontisphaera persica]
MQLEQYLPVLMLLLLAVAFTAFMLIGSVVAGRLANRFRLHRAPSKDIPYECGMIPSTGHSTRLTVKFYLVALLFILFDIEVVFLYPWAVVYREMLQDPATRNLILFAMLPFLGLLFFGFFYELKKGGFNWRE